MKSRPCAREGCSATTIRMGSFDGECPVSPPPPPSGEVPAGTPSDAGQAPLKRIPPLEPETPDPERADAVKAALLRGVTVGDFETPQDAPAVKVELDRPEDLLDDVDGPTADIVAAKREARKRYARFKRSVESSLTVSEA